MGGMSHDSQEAAGLGELFHAAARSLRRSWTGQLAPFGLTPHQWRALNTIAGRPPHQAVVGAAADLPADDVAEGLRLKRLADLLHIAPRSATEVVDQLEAKGLVVRAPDPTDRRATLVSLTEAGSALRFQIRDVRRRDANEYFARLSPGDRAELARILGALAEGNPGGADDR
jgi:DNA-binding MarR family transcriptional regulator